MSDVTPSVPSEQVQSPTPNPAPEQQPESGVQEQAAAAAERAAEQEAAARQEADATFKAAVREYRKGERSYRAGLLESGRLADLYCRQRMTLGDKRAAAVQALEGELAKWSSTAVDVNRLVGTYHAYRLLAEEPAVKADAVPYGHYRDAWGQLAVREAKDTPAETWRLLPGLEAECKAAFLTATEGGLSKAAVLDQVKSLLRQHADRQAEE